MDCRERDVFGTFVRLSEEPNWAMKFITFPCPFQNIVKANGILFFKKLINGLSRVDCVRLYTLTIQFYKCIYMCVRESNDPKGTQRYVRLRIAAVNLKSDGHNLYV